MTGRFDQTVSAVVITCGANNHLCACLESLMKQSKALEEIIVIDNSLRPEVCSRISSGFAQIKVYTSPRNLFYCESLNKGITLTKGECILCLNDDVVLDKHFIEEALNGFSSDPKVGMVSGKILRPDAKTIDSAGLFLSAWRSARERGYGVSDRGQFERRGYIFGVNGAAAFYRRKMLEEIKLEGDYFDPDFRMFYEDLDIAWRAQNSGWKAYYMPSAIAYHVRGASFRPKEGINKPVARSFLNDELHADLIKNRYLCIIKNESLAGFILHLPFILIYDCFQWVYALTFRPKAAKLLISCGNYFRSAFKKRKSLQKR
ncbi:MAG: glycosyltransferase [Candidatus Omnitrophica bacterium]|nr:glycosyltransferase [Candidatus Omnitrophota bacterium]